MEVTDVIGPPTVEASKRLEVVKRIKEAFNTEEYSERLKAGVCGKSCFLALL